LQEKSRLFDWSENKSPKNKDTLCGNTEGTFEKGNYVNVRKLAFLSATIIYYSLGKCNDNFWKKTRESRIFSPHPPEMFRKMIFLNWKMEIVTRSGRKKAEV